MIHLVLFVLFTFSNSLVGMQNQKQPLPKKEQGQIQPKITSLPASTKQLSKKERGQIHPKVASLPMPIAYFEQFRALESDLNKSIDRATDYKSTHEFIIGKIELNPYINWQDKQELYNHYEEVLYKKFENMFKKIPAQ